MKTRFLSAACLLLLMSCGHRLKDGEYTLTVLSTNDVHGSWFDSTYIGGGIKRSLFAMNHYIDSVRMAEGDGNVLLVDAGDCLQGDNAAYYYNYIDTVSPHLFPRLMSYMRYDAIAWGNHDVETGHAVYDRVQRELVREGIPFLAANAVRDDNGKSYFPPYKIIYKANLRIAVLGYENANIKAWLAENVWKYGFIRRWAPGSCEQGHCENIHLLYTGRIHAAAMHALGLGLEDYLSLLHREGEITIQKNGEPWAIVYCFPQDGVLTVSVPAEGSVSAGLDNTGWAVAAVALASDP